MKRLSHLFVFLALASSSFAFGADVCSEIEEQLIVLESAIQAKKLPRCEDGQTEKCCDPARPLSCKTFLELHTKHNELMGKLVIFEGLISIGKAIEADHSSIQKLELKDLRSAKRSVNNFLTSYQKAALLDTSLEADFWMDKDGKAYEGDNLDDLEEYVQAQCSREDEKIKTFCDRLDAASDNPNVNQRDIRIALANFARADQKGRISPADRFSDYENYRKALELSIGGEVVGYDRDNEQIQEIARLGEMLKDPENGRLEDQEAARILEIARNLDGVSVNYGSMVRPTEDFETFFDTNIANGIAGFNHASRTLLSKDKMLENMDKLEEVFTNHKAGAMVSITNNIKEQTTCSGSQEALLSCFKEQCRPSVTGDCSQTADPRAAQALHSINHQLEGLENYQELAERIAETKDCLMRPSSSEEAQSCVEQIRRKIGAATKDDVDQLRSELHKTELAMEQMNLEKGVNDLKLSKAMGLMAYRSKGCGDNRGKVSVSEFKTVCSRESIITYSQEALSLSQHASEIIDFSQNPFINKDLEMPEQNYAAYKTEFLRRCDEGRSDDKLCELYQNDAAISGRAARAVQDASRSLTANRTASRRLPSRVKMDKVEEVDGTGAFFSGLGAAALTKGVPFFLHYENSRSRHKSMMQYHRNRLSFMNTQYDMWAANPTVPVYTYPQTNYGYSLYDYGSAGQFGGSNSAQLYRHPQDYTQFSFTPTMVMDPYGSSGFSPNSGNSGSSSGQSEGFNFNP